MRPGLFTVFTVLLASVGSAQDVPSGLARVPTLAPATITARFVTEEAKQGVAVDARFFYPISNNRIGKYYKMTGKRVAQWEGPPALYPHMNSCIVDGAELVCAASNYPAVPMSSAVEVFDTRTLRHLRTISLPPMPGSLTWIERHHGAWFAGYANYPEARGGEPGMTIAGPCWCVSTRSFAVPGRGISPTACWRGLRR